MTKKEKAFIQTVTSFYKEHGRHTLPWRKTKDPYRILVSEVMLQQTQVDRVLPKYQQFIEAFPTVALLAQASLRDVLLVWQGLGYNRRAKMLHNCAKEVIHRYTGTFPKTYDELVELPGIGPYTASAVLAFAHNLATPLIETNVRSVYLHHFFNDASDVSDTELLPIIARTLDGNAPREWYWALMDYGSHIKREFGNPNTRSTHYTKQSTFKGSDRQIRGAIIRLLAVKACSRSMLQTELRAFEDIRIDAQLERLKSEGMLVQKGKLYRLP